MPRRHDWELELIQRASRNVLIAVPGGCYALLSRTPHMLVVHKGFYTTRFQVVSSIKLYHHAHPISQLHDGVGWDVAAVARFLSQQA